MEKQRLLQQQQQRLIKPQQQQQQQRWRRRSQKKVSQCTTLFLVVSWLPLLLLSQSFFDGNIDGNDNDSHGFGFIIIPACHGFGLGFSTRYSTISSSSIPSIYSSRTRIATTTITTSRGIPSIHLGKSNTSGNTSSSRSSRSSSSTSLSLSSSYETKDGSQNRVSRKDGKHSNRNGRNGSNNSNNKSNGSNKSNVTKRQRENESQLQYLSKSGKTQQALTLYNDIWNDYNAWQTQTHQQQTQQQEQTQSNGDSKSNSNSNSNNNPPPPAPTVRLMNHAIDACARARPAPLTSEALRIFTTATGTTTNLRLVPNVYTYGSLIRSYARIGNVQKCQDILNDMKTNYNIVPNSVIYSTIISACERVDVGAAAVGATAAFGAVGAGNNNKYNNNNNNAKVNVKVNVDVNKALALFQEAVNSNKSNNNSSSRSGSSSSNRSRSSNNRKMDMNIAVYNTVLSVFAKGGEWKLACQLLDEMEGSECSGSSSSSSNSSSNNDNNNNKIKKQRIVPPSVNIPPPDHITYGTVMAACERAKQWNTVLKIAERVNKHDYYQLDGISLSSALKACQQLGLADDALRYLNQMKQLNSESYRNNVSGGSGGGGSNMYHSHYHNHRRKPLQGPDDVAYRLAISACARSGYMESKNSHNDGDIRSSSSSNTDGNTSTSTNNRGPRWIDGIRLLREMEQVTGSAPDVIAYTAAIGGCATAGEYKRAIQLLKEMKRKGVEPNVVTFTAVISACASACARRYDDYDEDNVNENVNDTVNGSTSALDDNLKQNQLHEATINAAMKASLTLLSHMTKVGNGIEPNIVTYNAAIRVCAEAMNVSKAFALLDELKNRDLEPTIVTYGTLMTACERVGDVDGATKVFRFMKGANIQPNEIIYGAAISCFRKASDSERTFRLLRKMLAEKLCPNTATFNTVVMSQTETKNVKNAMAVYDLMKLSSTSTSTSPHYGRPNNQTYNMLIRCMAMNAEPAKAEYFLNEMRDKGLKPDVDLFTMTVTAYEKNVQPRKALSLMESMREEGYDFYDIKVLDAAFKQGVKIINNVVGNSGQVEQQGQVSRKDNNRETTPDSQTLGSDFA